MGENEKLIALAVLGVSDAMGRPDPYLWRCCSAGYPRAWFFTMVFFTPLQGKSSQIEELARAHRDIGEANAPNRHLIKQAIDGNDGVSLQSLMKIGETIKVLRDSPATDDRATKMATFLRKRFPHPEIYHEDSIIPAFRSLDVTTFQSLCRNGSKNDLAVLGSTALKGFTCHPVARREFFKRLESGYATPNPKVTGIYKLTDLTVDTLYPALQKQFSTLKSDAFPEKDELFPISPTDGPRKGQVSKALPVPFGNRLP